MLFYCFIVMLLVLFVLLVLHLLLWFMFLIMFSHSFVCFFSSLFYVIYSFSFITFLFIVFYYYCFVCAIFIFILRSFTPHSTLLHIIPCLSFTPPHSTPFFLPFIIHHYIISCIILSQNYFLIHSNIIIILQLVFLIFIPST